MDSDIDPMVAIFGTDDADLYHTLGLDKNAAPEDIKKAYRRAALLHHPDKHTNSSEEIKAEASVQFQRIGFAYAVLSDAKKRSRYDTTGRTDEAGLSCGEDGWEAYFEDLFDRVTRGKLDEMKKEYQGSSEEVNDLKEAYILTNGSIEEIMTHIPHSTHDDEARFVITLSKLVANGELEKTKQWETSVKDEKAKLSRQKAAQKEATEAEALAKELGVWDEFFGSGKTGKRKKGKAKAKEDEEEDVSALQALILKKNHARHQDSFLDGLAAKYSGGKSSSGKRQREEEPDLDDEEFKRIQSKMFKSNSPPRGKKGRGKRAKK
ncbi:hypothetical protein DL96DRAFT_1577611 [Flagelloscypha sp. PMI_526]|nr:hypothetical protein DL96DRAFT_1577611 [Flagelloscypha sp. PMI_526]